MDRVGPIATECTATEATASGHGHLLPGCMGTAVVLSGESSRTRLAAGLAPTEATFGWSPVFRNCPHAGRLTLPHPAHYRLAPERCWRLVLAVTPGAALAGLMFLASARSADHRPILAGRDDQAALAFARRIRLRRSADRSSSFNPPQVPYFSGLLTA